LSHDALVDQLMRGALGPCDLAARQGGQWVPIIEHPDLQSFFLPGNVDADRLVGSLDQRRRDRRAGDVRRIAKVSGSVAVAMGALGLAGLAVRYDLFVVPTETVEQVSSFFGRTGSAVTEQVALAVDEGAAERAYTRRRTLPGGEVVEALRQKWPNAAGAAHLRLQRGRVGLWAGTNKGYEEAREHLEQAVVLSPEDPETWASLAELYSLQLVDEPGLSDHLTLSVDRVAAMAPDAVSTSRAAAMSSFAHGNFGAAADLANRCASNPGSAGQAGSSTDLGCALVAAEAQGLLADLKTLHKRYEGAMRISLPLARLLLEKKEYREAAFVAAEMVLQHPEEVEPVYILFQTHLALGEWADARRTGQRIASLAPGRIGARVQVAEMQLKVFGEARAALDAYKAAIAHPRFAGFANRSRALADAASAAIQAGKYDDAIEFADAALVIAKRDAVAGLQKARALQKIGKSSEAESLLRSTEPTLLEGHDLARWHVTAAAFYIEAGRERLAESELRSASETDAFWPRVPIEAARNRLRVGDRDGAIRFLEQAAYMDLYVDEARNPLQMVWAEETDWRKFRRDLEDELLGDARFASRGYGVVGVVSMYDNMSDAKRVLEQALAGGAEAPAANAALAQFHMHRGNTRLALKHCSQVVETSANSGVLYGVRGWAMARDDNAAQSRAAFVQALEDSPNEASIYRWRAEAQMQGGDLRGARKSLGEALRLMPDDIVSKGMLVELQEDEN
jgi:tetratricopeptide (TPR) repeat protein